MICSDQHPLNRPTAEGINEGIASIKVNITCVNHVYFFEVKNGVTVGVGRFDMKGMDGLAVEVKGRRVVEDWQCSGG